MTPRKFGNDDVEVVKQETAYRGFFQIDRYKVRHRLFEGGWSKEITREVFERGQAAAVLPYDPETDSVVLIEQFRIGAVAAGEPPWLIEIVAGIIEDGESAEDVVRREAVEEAGLVITDLESVTRCFLTPGGASETCHIFCGRASSANACGIHGVENENEDIRVSTHNLDDAARMIADGTIKNAITIIALQWLLLHRETIREKWRA